MIRFLIAAAMTLTATAASATDDDLRSVAAMRYHDRVLLVFAPALADARLRAQQAEFAKAGLEASERDLVLVQVAGNRVLGAHDKADGLRRRFHVAPPDYRTFLIGKDGHAARSFAQPVPAARIMQAIDAMPMRQDEMRRARAGLGKSG